jgi:hypothetical protein
MHTCLLRATSARCFGEMDGQLLQEPKTLVGSKGPGHPNNRPIPSRASSGLPVGPGSFHILQRRSRFVEAERQLRADSGQLTENQWCASLSLESHWDKYKTAGGSLWLGVETICRDIKKWTGTDVEQDVLEKMTCSVRTVSLTNLYFFRTVCTLNYVKSPVQSTTLSMIS